MDKTNMRFLVSTIEEMVDVALTKWEKLRRWENGEVVHLGWQLEQTYIRIDIFWEEKKEVVRVRYISPRIAHEFFWHGLSDETIDKIMDRIGNLAFMTLHPKYEPPD